MLKKLTTALLACTAFALPQAFALSVLPEAGVSLGVGTKEQYAEAKVLPRTTIGYKRADRDQYGNQNDIYAKYNVIGSKVQLLAGATTSTNSRARRPSTAASASLRRTSWASSPMRPTSRARTLPKPRPASITTSPSAGA